MKIHLISFGSSRFKNSLKRIKNEAENCNFFQTINCLNESDLPINYRIKYFLRLSSNPGFGYWMWKSYITKLFLERINDGEILLYADAGCSFNKEGKKRFNEYINLLLASNFSNLSFQTVHLEKEYTKGDVFKYFKLESNEEIKNSCQLLAGVYFLIKNKKSMDLISEWYAICHNHKKLIDDSMSKYPNDVNFIAHRHDQSIFSLLRKLSGTEMVKDETFFSDWENNKCFPIHTRRLR